MKKKLKRIGLIVGIILLLIQLVPSGLETDPDYSTDNLMVQENANGEIEELLINHCMDCHSAHVRMPWYFNIKPLTFMLVHHVNEGREHVNFAEWASMDRKEKLHALEECIEMIEENEMPLKSYTFTHAEMTSEQRTEMLNWFKSVEQNYLEED